ncbi:MAG TPA: hypothetical protein VH419_11920 [Nocardioidaceae bacterium]
MGPLRDPGAEPLLTAESVEKYYRNGEVSAHALVDLVPARRAAGIRPALPVRVAD